METLYINRQDWNAFIKGKSAESALFAPFEREGFLIYQKVDGSNCTDIFYEKARPVEPLKLFLLPFKESVVPMVDHISDVVVMGPAACDVKALDILDNVFLKGQYKDANYAERRAKTLIVSFDCGTPYPWCFCTLVGLHPYPDKGFDINISLCEEGLMVDIGSERGRKFIGNDQKFFQTSGEQLKKRQDAREKIQEIIRENNRSFDFSQIDNIRRSSEKQLWQIPKQVEDCVQCGSCTNNCPTCVCFLLEDTGNAQEIKKHKVWDSCLFPGYARMAAGSSPRPSIYERYANRILCKYWYMMENFGMKGCTGCGRCIAGCLGKIDKREVITEVLRETNKRF